MRAHTPTPPHTHTHPPLPLLKVQYVLPENVTVDVAGAIIR